MNSRPWSARRTRSGRRVLRERWPHLFRWRSEPRRPPSASYALLRRAARSKHRQPGGGYHGNLHRHRTSGKHASDPTSVGPAQARRPSRPMAWNGYWDYRANRAAVVDAAIHGWAGAARHRHQPERDRVRGVRAVARAYTPLRATTNEQASDGAIRRRAD